MACLDTTALVDLRRRPEKPQRQRVESALHRSTSQGEALTTTRINEAEFRVGIYLSPNAALELAEVERVLAPLRILELNAAAAEQFAHIKANQIAIGRPVGDLDLLIAAIALVHSQSLLTRNPKHFIDVPGLGVESY